MNPQAYVLGQQPAYARASTADRLGQSNYDGQDGLTKRELFAILALQGLAPRGSNVTPQYRAQQAVQWADALLEELAK